MSTSDVPNAPVASKDLMEAAVEIAHKAGEITLQWFKKADLAVDFKGDGTPVTEADKAAERFIRTEIDRVAPNSSFVGEEEGTSVGTSGLTWYIDPIDGTKGFSRGVPLYSTLLAINDEHGPCIGVIHIPATGESVWAGRGLGAHTQNGRASVSKRSELKGALVTTSAVSRWGHDLYARFVDAGVDICGWGDGYGFLMAATGRIDAMIDLNGPSVWDFAPMPIIFSEAGGCFSAPDGSAAIDQKSGIGTNSILKSQLLGLINK